MSKFFFWLFFMAVILLSLLPVSASVPLFSWQDKLYHTVAYAWLYGLAIKAYGHSLSGCWLAAGLIVLGLCIEIAQSMTGYRYADLWDMLANTAGILLMALFMVVRGK